MDGNGRWATARGMARAEGHRRGAHAVRRAVRAAPALGITTLTLFAFSSDNWKRPQAEVATLLRLFGDYLRAEQDELRRNGVRLSVIGRRDRLPGALTAAIAVCEAATARCLGLHLRLAIDYSARDAIHRAAGALAAGEEPSADAFRERLGLASRAASAPDLELLVRTGGEHRVSDFRLWGRAYAEICFRPHI